MPITVPKMSNNHVVCRKLPLELCRLLHLGSGYSLFVKNMGVSNKGVNEQAGSVMMDGLKNQMHMASNTNYALSSFQLVKPNLGFPPLPVTNR